MDGNREVFDAIEKTIEENADLKETLIKIQREAVTDGWTVEEHSERVLDVLAQNGVEASREAILSLIKDACRTLTDGELDHVDGGWGIKSCNKNKICPGGTGRSCYPHC